MKQFKNEKLVLRTTNFLCIIMGIAMLLGTLLTVNALNYEIVKVLEYNTTETNILIIISCIVLGTLTILFSIATYLLFEKSTRKT